MIFTDRTIIVQKGTSSINDTIVLYRGDKEVQIRFSLNEGSPFRFGSGASPNIIEKTEAAYGQLVIKAPGALPPIFSEVMPTIGGKIIFTITTEMINEITEVGNYTFQIRLLDENMDSRATLPEVKNGIEIREPIASEDVTNEVGEATVGYALTTAGTTEDAFDSQGNYNKTTWGTGDRITDAKLNKIEAAIDGVNKKVANAGDISITDTGNYFTNSDVEGALQEAGSQIKDIVKQTKDIISTDDTNMVKVKERLFDFNSNDRQYIFVGDSLREANGRWTFKKMVYKLAKCGISPCLIGRSGLKAEHFSKINNIQDDAFPTTDDVIRTIKGTGANCVVDICLGTNDLSKTSSEIITYLKTSINNILTAKPDTLFILTTPNRYMTNATSNMDSSNEKIYAVIKQVVDDLGNVAFSDVQSNVFKKDEDITPYMIDNIHPNKLGQYKIGEYKIKQLFNEVDSSIYDINFKEQIFTNSNGTITTIKYAIDYNNSDNSTIYLKKDYENKWRFAKIADSKWVYLSELISHEGIQPLMPNFNTTDSLYGIVETKNIQALIDDNPTKESIKLDTINSIICNKITQPILQTPTTIEVFLSQIKYWDINGTFDPTDIKAKNLGGVSLKVGFYKTEGDDPSEVYLKRSSENDFMLAFSDGNAISKTMYIDRDGIYDVKPITWDTIRVTGKLKVKNVEKMKDVIAIDEHVKIINAQQYSPIIQKSIVELLDY